MNQDILCPQGNELELLEAAKRLGFKEILFLYGELPKKTITLPGLAVKTAVLIKSVSEIGRFKNKVDFIVAPFGREFFESKQVDYVINHEIGENKDFFYQKRGGLDDASCALAKKNNIKILFDLSSSDDKLVFGRLCQNAALCRKHRLEFAVATMAKEPLALRSKKDLDGITRVLKLV
jgi:RNase P/RNase MRP subunit p30